MLIIESGVAWVRTGDTARSATHGECAEEIERLRASLRAIRNHWNEFGPDHGFDETLEVACKPIQINTEADVAPWDGLAKAVEIVESHTCTDFCDCRSAILRDLKASE